MHATPIAIMVLEFRPSAEPEGQSECDVYTHNSQSTEVRIQQTPHVLYMDMKVTRLPACQSLLWALQSQFGFPLRLET